MSREPYVYTEGDTLELRVPITSAKMIDIIDKLTPSEARKAIEDGLKTAVSSKSRNRCADEPERSIT